MDEGSGDYFMGSDTSRTTQASVSSVSPQMDGQKWSKDLLSDDLKCMKKLVFSPESLQQNDEPMDNHTNSRKFTPFIFGAD